MKTYQNFIELLRAEWGVKELAESPLLRNDEAFFTFSPFQDTENNFLKVVGDSSLYVKYQRTIRKINALDLTNPLNLNYQVTYAVQNYERINQLELIENLIDKVRQFFFSSIASSDVEITYPDVLHEFFNQRECPFSLKEVDTTSRYKCNLDLPGKHFYIKVRMKYRTGSINVVDFVLVNYDEEDFTSQLDSIWVEDLIDLLAEKQKFIFDEEKYREEKKIVENYTTTPRDQHVIINDVRTVLKIISLGILPAAKGIHSEVKRTYLSSFDLFLFPSLFEGLSIAALEAQANGVPILASTSVYLPNIEINSNIQFQDLTTGPEKWTRILLEMLETEKRISQDVVRENFRHANFDINIEAPKLEKEFLKSINSPSASKIFPANLSEAPRGNSYGKSSDPCTH